MRPPAPPHPRFAKNPLGQAPGPLLTSVNPLNLSAWNGSAPQNSYTVQDSDDAIRVHQARGQYRGGTLPDAGGRKLHARESAAAAESFEIPAWSGIGDWPGRVRDRARGRCLSGVADAGAALSRQRLLCRGAQLLSAGEQEGGSKWQGMLRVCGLWVHIPRRP